ncbi:MAG: hypothetical protein ACYSWP_22135 [Planctomycetota bacterium]|jgi:hypothetical protein
MKRKGVTRIEVLSIAGCILLLVLVLIPGLLRSRFMAFRLMCQTNLTGLGRAMDIYAEDNEGRYPRAGGAGATWSPHGAIMSWYGGRSFREDYAFGYLLDENGQIEYPGEATITSSWYLLIKYYNLLPKQFVCKSDWGAEEFKLHRYSPPPYVPPDNHPVTLQDVFDFGQGGRDRRGDIHPWAGEVVSYAYHMPYSDGPGGPSFELTAYSSPASPVAADRNPYLDINAGAVDSNSNSVVHEGLGQNVLYKDGSVRFESSPKVGIGGDNIYTYDGGPEGTGPTENGDGVPVDKNDAYLVSESNYN